VGKSKDCLIESLSKTRSRGRRSGRTTFSHSKEWNKKGKKVGKGQSQAGNSFDRWEDTVGKPLLVIREKWGVNLGEGEV